MIFNSFEYLIFLVVFSGIFYLINPKKRWILLLSGSYFFYMWWKWEFIFLIIFSTLIDFYCGIKMSNSKTKQNKKLYLFISLFSNLGILFFFKYFNFFTDSLNYLLTASISPIAIILPMGISFYTFQTLAYSLDIYNGKIKAETHLGKFALYVSFFPQLVAGPIERANKLLPQFQLNDNKFDFDNLILGLTKITLGLYKKVVVADLIAIYVQSIYGNHELYTGLTPLLATYLFAIQIYCDFSGYSDIAIGSARILGYDLMENFRTPYFSKSITEFWRKWHISLSTWLRDYLYIPLGGNRGGKILNYRNLMLTMLLGGLWHGSSWNFIIWGGLNGIYLAFEKALGYNKLILKKNKIFQTISGLFVFNLICLSWVFFRAENFNKAVEIILNIFKTSYFFDIKFLDTNIFLSIMFNIIILIILDYFLSRNKSFLNNNLNVYRHFFMQVFLVLLILIFGVSEGSNFIYFQF